ncbi:MAG: magnesium chelatase subunit D [Burkholderiaceae bacterium]|nr:magnesium chelatase subunit D [Burkholderiaceae bacterium]
MAAALLAVDPSGIGGVLLRSAGGPAREDWLAALAQLLPATPGLRRVPLHISDDRLLGGLDLAATLHAGRPVAQRGLLAQADGGVIVLAMAERLSAATAARIAAVLDQGKLVTERHGVGTRSVSRLGVVALDEGQGADEHLPAPLRERLGIHLILDDRAAPPAHTRLQIQAARSRLGSVDLDDDVIEAVCTAAVALGIESVRAPMLALRVARAAAALAGRVQVDAGDAALAAGLVLAPRATRLPAPAESDRADQTPDDPPPAAAHADPQPATDTQDPAQTDPAPILSEPLSDLVLAAARAAIPPGLLAALLVRGAGAPRGQSAGRAGAARAGVLRGRPIGARRGEPQHGARLNVIETLRAAAPWQTLRRREAQAAGLAGHGRVRIRREDFHVWRFKQRSETTTVFVVDASGSAALHRLAEAKGAVELLLADCYVRRDSVAVIAFRGQGAEVLLPPTRSLVRAKRSLAGLPGGGGTPLACGIDAAVTLAAAVRARGATPVIVLLTDGRANIARDGSPGRERAAADASVSARRLQLEGFAALLLDTSPQPQDAAHRLADAMGARYLPLPHAGAATLSQAVHAGGVAPPAR